MKGLILGPDAEYAVREVVGDFEAAVGSTLGPNGNYVIISSGTSSKVTKDGATVAKSIDYDDPFKAHIANVIREAAVKTETECGDGTTTTALFACNFFNLLSKFNSYREHEEVRKLVEELIEQISNYRVFTKEAIYAASLITANKDESIASLVFDIVNENPGIKPDIKLVEGNSNKDTVERIEGHRIHVTPIHFTKDTFNVIPHNTIRFVYIDQRMDTPNQFAELLQAAIQYRNQNDTDEFLIFVLKGCDQGATALEKQHYEKLFVPIADKVGLVNANIGGGMSLALLEDMQAITGGVVYRSISEFGVKCTGIPFNPNNQYEHTAKYIQINNVNNESGTDIAKRITLIKTELDAMTGSGIHTAYAAVLRKRLAGLSHLHYIIHVGSETHSDYLERKDRFDDVITSTVTNTIHGVVPGFNTVFIAAIIDNPTLSGIFKVSNPDPLLGGMVKIFVEHTNRLKNGIDAKLSRVNNLSTGEHIDVEEDEGMGPNLMKAAEQFGIYDPAYTVISALRGGFKTGQILAKTKSIVVSNRFASQLI